MIKRYYGLFMLEFILIVALLCPMVDAGIPDNEDYYSWNYNWNYGSDYHCDNDNTIWNTLRTQGSGKTFSTSNSPPFEVWVSESRGKKFITRSLCEVDLTNITEFWTVQYIKFTVYVSVFSDNQDGSVRLYLSNGTSFQYGNVADYNYNRHYQSGVSYRSPNGYGTVTGTGWYNITWTSTSRGFDLYVFNNMMNLSFSQEDDYLNNAPAVDEDAYIRFNITNIEVNLVACAGFKSKGSDWALISIPVNSSVNKTDLRWIKGVTNYSWSEAVSNGVISDWCYGFNITNQNYYNADVLNGYYGYWVCMFDTDYEVWHSSFVSGNGSGSGDDFDDLLFYVQGFADEPLEMLVIGLLVMLYLIYKIPFKYFFVHSLLAVLMTFIILAEFSSLYDLFPTDLSGQIFWLGMVFFVILMAIGKLGLFMDWFKKEPKGTWRG